MYKCPDCPKEYENKQAYASHRRHCKLHQRGLTHWDMLSQENKSAFQEPSYNRTPMPNCGVCGNPVSNRANQYCSRKCANSRSREGRTRSAATREKISNSLKGKLFSQGRWIKIIPCRICGVEFKPSSKTRLCCSRKCAIIAGTETRRGRKRPNTKSGGFREGSGRSKSGWYKGLYCNSTYELIFVAYHAERGSQVKRCNLLLEYEYQGKKRIYHPDFEISGTIYEIKGFWTEQAKFKSACFPQIVVVGKEEIKNMQSHTSLKGKGLGELVSLYESSTEVPALCGVRQKHFHKNDRHQRFCSHACGVKGVGRERSARRADTALNLI